MNCPLNISLKAREQQFVGSSGTKARASSGHTIFDLSCHFVTKSRTEREALDAYHTWQEYDWLAPIGLEGFVARQVKTPQHSFKGYLSNSRFAAHSAVSFEVQPAPDNYNFDCVDPAIFPIELGSPTLNKVSIQRIDQNKTMTFSSTRTRRVRKMMGTASVFNGPIKLSITQFSLFITWLRCFLGSGGGQFSANWLVNPELGAWNAYFAAPFEATFEGNQWLINLKLVLVVDPEHAELNNLLIDVTQLRGDVCSIISNVVNNGGC